MTRPNFLLCVGAQKAGTSFLYRALSEDPAVALSTPKEMHVFDAYFLPEMFDHFRRRRVDALRERFDNETLPLTGVAKRKTAEILRHVRMYYDLGAYLDYFREIGRGKRLTGDITPLYSALRAEHFAEIRDLLCGHFTVKVVFLMRDPIDRIFSAMRMDDRNLDAFDSPAHERFAETFDVEKHRRRTEYEKTIMALEAVFAPEDIHYEFFENLFNPESFARLSDFLGIDTPTPDFGTRVNASPHEGKLGRDQIAMAREAYDPTYRFCLERFGAERLRTLWRYA